MFQESFNVNKKRLKELDKVYIEQNAPYTVGTKLLVKDVSGFERHAYIKGYKVNEGVIETQFKDKHGYNLFVAKPVIIKTI